MTTRCWVCRTPCQSTRRLPTCRTCRRETGRDAKCCLRHGCHEKANAPPERIAELRAALERMDATQLYRPLVPDRRPRELTTGRRTGTVHRRVVEFVD